MKLSCNWLREHVATAADNATLQARLTNGGLECELEPHCDDPVLAGVVVARVLSLAPHPDADKLRVCTVDAGAAAPVQVVCGAPNVREGLSVALAQPGAVLPGGQRIEAAELRGVASAGMLCSAAELGLGDGASGLLELDAEAPVGTGLAEWLALDDAVLHVELTPNRGDCLSVAGLAREALLLLADGAARTPEQPPAVTPDAAVKVRPVGIENVAQCPIYCALRIEDVDAARRSPDWLRERLRRSGVRSVSIVVDITNLVMLEMGQPLHAFDDNALEGDITVRQARDGERVLLLNGTEYALDTRDLVIADAEGPVALAGVMGGERAEVRTSSRHILLESACFLPPAVAGTGRRHKLHSDAVHRFERGVDPRLAQAALVRAASLIVALCGGRAGTPAIAGGVDDVARRAPVELRAARLDALLGTEIEPAAVTRILSGLGMQVEAVEGAWRVTPPSWRYDISLDVDLVEEVARIIGYDVVQPADYRAALAPKAQREAEQPRNRLRAFLGARGFQEAVCYSFVDAGLEARLQLDAARIALDNPIAEQMACMRTTLWSGLLPVVQHNLARQQRRQRFYELARVYLPTGGEATEEQDRLGLVMLGGVDGEHWDARTRALDFFDLKGEVEALVPGASVMAAEHPALHPGRAARVQLAGADIGWIGELHPAHATALDLPRGVLLAELDAEAVLQRRVPWQPKVSEFPASRRDLALEVEEAVRADDLVITAREAGPDFLVDVVVFDLYYGEGLKSGCKGIALGLIFQDYSRTLTQDLIDGATEKVASALHKRWGVTIRGQ